MQARYDDKAIGRMLSTDPMDVDPSTGANFNRYWYANDNPYRYTDPNGEMSAPGPASACAPGPYCGHPERGALVTVSGPIVDKDLHDPQHDDASGTLSQAADAGQVASSDEYTRSAPPNVSQIESDSAVQNWEDQAKHSDAFRDRDEYKRYEEGVWVYTDDKTGGVKLIDMPASIKNPATRLYSSIVPGDPPALQGFTARLAIHTHPFPLPDTRSVRAGYLKMAFPEPSQADVNYVNSRHLNGIVISHTGEYYFGGAGPSN